MNHTQERSRSPKTHLVPKGVEYHWVLKGEKRRIGRGLLGMVLLIGGMITLSAAFAIGASHLDDQLRGETAGRHGYTPLFHAAAMASVALLIPWSQFLQRWLYGIPGASLHSVVSRFRFDVFGRALLLIAPAWVATAVANVYLAPEESIAISQSDVLWLLAATFLLTPLQAAGEEYALRGFVFRVAASWARGPAAGLVLGLLVSTAVFAVIHLSADVWLNGWYVVFALGTALITWRSGGLEIAIVLHALFNTLSFVFSIALGSGLGEVTDRSAGAATAAVLIPCGVVAATLAVVWFRTARSGPPRTPL